MSPGHTVTFKCSPVVFYYICFPVCLIDALTIIVPRRPQASTYFPGHCALRCNPYLWVREPGEVRVQIELDAFGGTWQGDASDQEDQQHDVGEGCRDIHDLPRREKRVRPGWQWRALFTQHSSLSMRRHTADCPLRRLPWIWLDAWTTFSVSICAAQAQKDSWLWASPGSCCHSCQWLWMLMSLTLNDSVFAESPTILCV